MAKARKKRGLRGSREQHKRSRDRVLPGLRQDFEAAEDAVRWGRCEEAFARYDEIAWALGEAHCDHAGAKFAQPRVLDRYVQRIEKLQHSFVSRCLKAKASSFVMRKRSR